MANPDTMTAEQLAMHYEVALDEEENARNLVRLRELSKMELVDDVLWYIEARSTRETIEGYIRDRYDLNPSIDEALAQTVVTEEDVARQKGEQAPFTLPEGE